MHLQIFFQKKKIHQNKPMPHKLFSQRRLKFNNKPKYQHLLRKKLRSKLKLNNLNQSKKLLNLKLNKKPKPLLKSMKKQLVSK